jgi:cell division protein FtsB
MIIDICLLLSLALFTLPLYTITSHTLNIDRRLAQQIVQQQKEMQNGGSPHGDDHSHWEDGH